MFKKVVASGLSLMMVLSSTGYQQLVQVHAETNMLSKQLSGIKSVEADKSEKNVVWVTFTNGYKGKLTFLDNGIFRYNVDPKGEFSEYATPRSSAHKARIQQYPDDSDKYKHPEATVTNQGGVYTISAGDVTVTFNQQALMSVKSGNKVVLQETSPLSIGDRSVVQTLAKNDNENYYGGGTQNGRFVHTGKTINIANESGWNDGQVSSPNPFYWSTAGYGVLRNTFADGKYDFGETNSETAIATHDEGEFDAYYFVSDGANGAEVSQDILQEYFKVTGNPALLPEYGFYEGHLNCYNRDAWADGEQKADPSKGNKTWVTTNPDGTEFKQTEAGGTGYEIKENLQSESLMGKGPTTKNNVPSGVTTPEQFSAKAVLDRYVENDMPLGYFLPNDGYGCGYGQNGYKVTGGVEADGSSNAERTAAIDANVANLKEFTDYANSKGVDTGLWTQSQLSPDSNNNTSWHLLRDFKKEVKNGGITTLKTDVAWVGQGYSMQLDGVKTAYDTITTEVNKRPNIISLDGWAGSQRFNSVWTGDQAGGNWEYIRFHIPTYIGQSLSGNPNIGSDMDGIHGGAPLIATRDYQWKTFTPQMLNMDGWGTYTKAPHAFADPYKSTSRMYLKLKGQLLPYIYTSAASASNLNTKNGDTGLPMIRAMFLEFPNDDYAYSKNMQYQYMFGDAFLVAPVYQNTELNEETGADIRNDIYLPKGETWIDYFTGKQYRGGTVINNFDAPLWKLPLFVKNGSIVPMYEENNSPDKINRANRIVEFWPEGESTYTAYEDDGKSITNKTEKDEDYGVIDNISYGNHSELTYKSVVNEEKKQATLTAEKVNVTGSYDGYSAEKNTTFVVNVSKKPTKLTAKNGSSTLKNVEVNSKAEFDAKTPNAGEAVFFYDVNPTIETYANEHETKIKEMVKDVKVAPKLYVKFAKTNATENAQQLVIDGFVNDGNLPNDGENASLDAPKNIEYKPSSDSIALTWDEVEGATSYDVEADGIVYSMLEKPAYTHSGLNYLEKHTYRVRSVNKDGHSEWSELKEVSTLDDPYRNVPKGMTVSYDQGNTPAAYAGKFEYMVDGDDVTEYSSADAGVFNGKSFTIDMKKIYSINKLDYVFRQDGSNGTIKKFKLSYSNDGVNWKKYKDGEEINLTPTTQWPLGDKNKLNTQNVNARYATVDLEQFKARYIKVELVETAGGFLQAYEIRPYHVDKDKGVMPGDFEANGIINDNDEVWLDSHNPEAAGARKGGAFYESDANKFDLNENGIFDAYDIAVLTTQLNGGVKEKTNASGVLSAVPSKQNVKAGETFTVDIYGSGLKNVYAFDFELSFDKGALSYSDDDFVVKTTAKTRNQKVYEYLHHEETDEKDRVYATITNLGNQTSLNGDMKLATVTLKANKELDLSNLQLSHGLVVGSSLNYVNGLDPVKPNEPSDMVEKRLVAHEDIVKAEAKSNGPVGDGNDIWASLDQNNSTYTNSNYGNAANAHPQVYTFELKDKMSLSKVGVRPRSANHYGQLGSFKVFVSDDKNTWTPVSDKVTVNATTADSEGYTSVELPKGTSAKYVKLELEPATASGDCVATSEVAIYSAASVKPTSIVFEKDTMELHIGHLTPVKAIVAPEDAANKLYEVTSDNSKVKVITSSDANGYYYSLLALEKLNDGEVVTLTATSKADPKLKDTMTVTVTDKAFVDDLNAAIAEAEKVVNEKDLYTSASVDVVEKALAAAKEAVKNGDQATVDKAEIDLLNAIAGLEFKGSDDTRPDSTNHIDEGQMEVISVTNYADSDIKDHIIDNNADSIWHSSYGQGAKLPVDAVIDLGAVYQLEQVDYLPRQSSSNGHITHYRIEVSTDNKTFTPVVEGYLPNNGYELDNKEVAKMIKFAPVEAQYVKFIALGTIGDSGKNNDRYASIAELDFYGTTNAAVTNVAFENDTMEMVIAEQKQLKAITTPSNSTEQLVWSSDKEDVVSVDQNGVATAKAAGTATITVKKATDANISASMTITVKALDKSALEAKIKEVSEFKATVKDEKVVAYLTEEIAKAQAVVDNAGATESDVTQAVEALTSAKDTAVKAIDVLNRFAAVKALDLSKFDPAGQEELLALISEVEELAKEPITNLDVLTEKVAKLEELSGKLLPLDVTTLENLIKVAEGIELDKYVDNDAKDAFSAALNKAKEVAANPKTLAEIKAAETALKDAEGKLVLKATTATKDALKDLYDEFAKLDLENYSNKHQEQIRDMMDRIQSALKDEQLSEDDAKALLSEAAKVYAELPAISPLPDPNNPGNGQNPDGNNGAGQKPNGDSTNTGDTTNAALYSMLLLASAGGVALIGMKKKKANKE